MSKQQWYKMTENEVIKVLESVVNWVEYNKVTTFSEYGTQVIIETDGSVETMGSNTRPTDDYAGDILYMTDAIGYGNIDQDYYLDGWGEVIEDGDFFLTDDGRKLEIKEAIEEAIEDGDFTDDIQKVKDQSLFVWSEAMRNYREGFGE